MEEQYLQQDTSFDNTFGKLINKLVDEYLPQIEQIQVASKPKYQYRELCKQLAPIYGRRLWTLPSQTWYTDYKLETAHKITEKYCKGNIRYLIKVMRGLPY